MGQLITLDHCCTVLSIQGLSIILPPLPQLATNYFASQHAGESLLCEEYSLEEQPLACQVQQGMTDAGVWLVSPTRSAVGPYSSGCAGSSGSTACQQNHVWDSQCTGLHPCVSASQSADARANHHRACLNAAAGGQCTCPSLLLPPCTHPP
jgi:hypothetical protein